VCLSCPLRSLDVEGHGTQVRADLLVLEALGREDDVVRGEVAAGVEDDALAELHREPPAAVGELPRFRQQRCGLVLLVKADQVVVEAVKHREVAGGELRGVEVEEVGVVGVAQDAALLDRLGGTVDRRAAEPYQPGRGGAHLEKPASRYVMIAADGSSLLRREESAYPASGHTAGPPADTGLWPRMGGSAESWLLANATVKRNSP